jgi:uncharacterized repeat protein (TIGR04138 family)
MLHRVELAEVVRKDPRYPFEAYDFVFDALLHTRKLLGRLAEDPAREGERECHVSGPELLAGIRDLALREFGMMARTVFHMWGIDKTDDFGEIIFNLVESNLMSKTEEDQRSDFRDVYDLDEALVKGFIIKLEEGE